VEKLHKEREIKFFQCIGDPSLTNEEIEEIKEYKAENSNHLTNFKKDKDIHRYEAEDSNDRITIPVDIPLKAEPKWNVLNNDLFSLRQRNLNNLVKIAATLMMRIRVNSRLAKLKARFEEVLLIL
jgi:hypothetical protein